MKQIKDYIGKKYAIQCNSKEEWDKICDLDKNKFPEWNKDNYKLSAYKLLCLSNDGFWFSNSSPEKLEKEGYTILKAEEFIEPESLIGRYLKCIKSNNWHVNTKVGDYLKITDVDNSGDLFIEHSCMSVQRLKEGEFELMPNGWTPEKEKPKFEKDKWYIIDCYSTNYYIKFDKLYDNDTCIQASDYIPINGPKVMGSGGFRDYKNAKAVNLSEIQQYLPDNHPDKQKPEETKPNLSDLYNTYIPLNNEEEYKQLLKFLPTIGFKLANNNYFKGCPSPTIEFYKNDVFNVLANGGQVYNKKLSISDLSKYGFKLQQTSENMFKKGDYIVITKDVGSSSFKYNYCYKQRENYHYLRSELDSYSCEYNGLSVIGSKCNSNWRYATKEEENEYNRLNKPFDVTTLVKNQPIKNNEEWIPQVGEWVIGWHDNYKDYKTKAWQVDSVSNSYVVPKKDPSSNTNLTDIRKAMPHEIPIEKHSISVNSNVIEVGDEVEIIKDGRNNWSRKSVSYRFIVSQIYLGEDGVYYLRERINVSEGIDSTYCKLIKKNNTPQTTKTDDFGSLQVTNTQTTDITIPKRASVTLKIAEKEVNINIKKQKPVKI